MLVINNILLYEKITLKISLKRRAWRLPNTLKASQQSYGLGDFS